MKKPKLYYIEWEDAYSNSDWFKEKDIENLLNQGIIIKEVGWLIKKSKTSMAFASSHYEMENQWGMLHTIPKTWIKKMKQIKLR